jgi:hypothetical protein
VPTPDFPAFLDRSLAVLRSEAPAHHAELAVLLGARGLCCEVDGRSVALCFDGARHALRPPDRREAVSLCTDRRTILDLVDGELTLLDALLEERLWLAGSADAVTRFDEALTCYLDGAIRCPSLPPLLEEFRRAGLEVTLLPAAEAHR